MSKRAITAVHNFRLQASTQRHRKPHGPTPEGQNKLCDGRRGTPASRTKTTPCPGNQEDEVPTLAYQNTQGFLGTMCRCHGPKKDVALVTVSSRKRGLTVYPRLTFRYSEVHSFTFFFV